MDRASLNWANRTFECPTVSLAERLLVAEPGSSATARQSPTQPRREFPLSTHNCRSRCLEFTGG